MRSWGHVMGQARVGVRYPLGWLLAAWLSGAGATGVDSRFAGDLAACVAEQSRVMPFSGHVAAGLAEQRFDWSQGFADAQGQMPVGRDTPFRLASLSKLFTRVAIGQLVDAGRLRLDDPVRRHLPELPVAYDAMTVAQLVAHRAGVAPMTRHEPEDIAAVGAAQTARALVPWLAAKPLRFEPGQQAMYSNGGYMLLGAVIEAVSGQTYGQYLATQLFEPLGMRRSGLEAGPDAAVPLTRLIAPGQPPAETPQPRKADAMFKPSSAGDALSSVSDLEAFAQALMGDKLLQPATKAALFPQQGSPWRLGHAGGTAGSNTGLWVWPERRAWLIVLSNFDPPAGEWMAQALTPLMLGEPCKAGPGRMPPQPTR